LRRNAAGGRGREEPGAAPVVRRGGIEAINPGSTEALRLAHQLDAARAALRRAGLALKRGTSDDLERAGLLHVGASLELASGRPRAAARLLRKAAATYQLYGDRREEGGPSRSSPSSSAMTLPASTPATG